MDRGARVLPFLEMPYDLVKSPMSDIGHHAGSVLLTPRKLHGEENGRQAGHPEYERGEIIRIA